MLEETRQSFVGGEAIQLDQLDRAVLVCKPARLPAPKKTGWGWHLLS